MVLRDDHERSPEAFELLFLVGSGCAVGPNLYYDPPVDLQSFIVRVSECFRRTDLKIGGSLLLSVFKDLPFGLLEGAARDIGDNPLGGFRSFFPWLFPDSSGLRFAFRPLFPPLLDLLDRFFLLLALLFLLTAQVFDFPAFPFFFLFLLFSFPPFFLFSPSLLFLGSFPLLFFPMLFLLYLPPGLVLNTLPFLLYFPFCLFFLPFLLFLRLPFGLNDVHLRLLLQHGGHSFFVGVNVHILGIHLFRETKLLRGLI